MIDTYRALRGRARCPWCNNLPDGLFGHLLDRAPKWLAMFWIFKLDEWLPFWKVGHFVHLRLHAEVSE